MKKQECLLHWSWGDSQDQVSLCPKTGVIFHHSRTKLKSIQFNLQHT